MWQWLSDSRGKVILILSAVWLAALLHDFRWVFVYYPLSAIALVIFLDYFVVRLRDRISYFSLSSVVTGLLIGLILNPAGGFFQLFLAALTAVFNKQFLRLTPHRHIFNPAAFGIVVASLAFNLQPVWWAAAWGLLPVIIIGLGMTLVLWQIRRLFLPLTFLLTYFLVNLRSSGPAASLQLSLDGTVFLFAFIMLPEPLTSLSRGKWQYLWGILVGFLVYLTNILSISTSDPLLSALLLANLIGFSLVRRLKVRPSSDNASR